MIPRLTFPALQQNQSALGLLPAFLEVLGKKIDACADQLELCSATHACMHLWWQYISRTVLTAMHVQDKLAENKHARAAEQLGLKNIASYPMHVGLDPV